MITNTGFFIIAMSGSVHAMLYSIFFQIIYSIVVLGIFIILLSLKSYVSFRVLNKITSLINLQYSNPGLALLFVLFLFSVGSLPPVLGFFGKYMFFVGLLQDNSPLIATITIMQSIVSMIAYLRLMKLIFFSKEESLNFYVPLSMPVSLILVLLLFVNVGGFLLLKAWTVV